MRLIQNKILDRTLKVLLGIIALFIVLLTVLQLYVNHNKHQFLAMINKKLSASLEGKVNIKDIDVNVWKHFPTASIDLKGLSINDSVYNRSLVSVRSVSSDINILRLITKQVDINSIKLTDGKIHVFTDSTGYSNNYLLKGKKGEDGSSGSGNELSINELRLHHVALVSENAIKKKWYGVMVNDMYANIEREDSMMHISMRENALVKGLGFNLYKGYFLQDKLVEANWKISFNRNSKHLFFDETPVRIDSEEFKLKGDFYLQDTINSSFKLVVTNNKLNYPKTAELFTPNIKRKIDLIRLEKPVSVAATLEGSLGYRTIPRVNVKWTVVNNELVTPVADLKNCKFGGSFTNEKNKDYPRTDDNSEVTLTGFSANWSGVLLGGTNITVTNLVHPILRFNLTSACTLDALNDKIGIESIKFLQGSAFVNLVYDGPLSADGSMLNNLGGSLSIKSGLIRYAPRNLTFSNCNGDIKFSRSNLEMNNFSCDLNKNHFEVQVSGQNLGRLATADPGKAVINCSVSTPALNLADFKTLFKKRVTVNRKASSTQVPKSVVQLDDALEKGILQLNVKAGDIKLNKFAAKDLRATLEFQNDDWKIKNASVLHADGKLVMSGNVKQVAENRHVASTKIDITDMDVQKLFYAFDNFGQDGITSENIRGIINTNANVNITVNDQGDLVPNSMDGYVDFSIRDGALVNHEPIQRIKKFIFKNRDLSNIKFATLKDRLDIRNNEIYIHRMEIASSVMRIYVEGIYSLADKTDISIQVPLKTLTKKESDEIPKNNGVDAKTGASIYLRAKPGLDGNIKVRLDLFKKFRDNKSVEEKLDSAGDKEEKISASDSTSQKK